MERDRTTKLGKITGHKIMTATLIKSPLLHRLNFPTICKLPNGLTIVAEQIPVESVNLSLWVKVGSAVESDQINGMAHFLEHMVFKGTPNLTSGEFETRIEERGAITNACTSQDYTHYYITTAPRDFVDLAPLQMDVVFNPTLEDEAFERERLVVLEEIRRSEDNVRRRTYQRAMELAFEKLPYRRSVLGPAAIVEKLTSQQMRDFHQTNYQPSAVTAVAVGNLPVETLIQTVAQGFNHSLPQQNLAVINPPEPDPWSTESPFTQITRQEFVDDSLQQARLVMIWRVPGLTELSETYALDVLSAILANGRTSRLIRDLRESRHLVSQISANNMTNQLQGTFSIIAHLPEENLPAAEAAIAEHLRILQTELATETEINRVGTQVANRFIFANETPSDRASMYGYYQSMVGDLGTVLNYPARIQALTARDLQIAARRYLSPDAYGVVVIKPASA